MDLLLEVQNREKILTIYMIYVVFSKALKRISVACWVSACLIINYVICPKMLKLDGGLSLDYFLGINILMQDEHSKM